MRKLTLLLAGLACLLAAGCGSSTSSGLDEAKLHQDLSKPPSLAGMGAKHPRGAKEPAGSPAGGTPAAPPAGQ